MNTNSSNRQTYSDGTKLILSLLVFMAFLFMPQLSNAQNVKADFSGTWQFNESKSNMGEMGGRGFGGGGDLTITQQGNNLSVTRTMRGRDGQSRTATSKYTLDGKESVNEMGRGGSSKSVVKVSSDGQSLNIETTSSFNERSFTSHETWTMPDKSTLKIETKRSTPNGERTITAVYDRK